MKVFSKYINEGCVTSDVNPGNSFSNTGVMNHLTPPSNIVTQIRNIFAPFTGIIAAVAEDGVSIKLHSSKFVDKTSIQEILYNYNIMRGTCLASFIMQQGLTVMKPISVGQYYVIYFSPSDIKTAAPGVEADPATFPCKEQLDEEAEMLNVIKEDHEEELTDITKQKLSELINSKDKVKAAKQMELLVGQQIELPREYYFAGVKDKAGNESIALRWKYSKRGGKNQTVEITKTLINIYDESELGVFVPDFDKDSMFQLPDEVKTLIENILEFLGASKTNDECVYSLSGSKDSNEKDDNKDDEPDNKDNKSDDSKDDKSKDNENDDKSKDNSNDSKDNDDLL